MTPQEKDTAGRDAFFEGLEVGYGTALATRPPFILKWLSIWGLATFSVYLVRGPFGEVRCSDWPDGPWTGGIRKSEIISIAELIEGQERVIWAHPNLETLLVVHALKQLPSMA